MAGVPGRKSHGAEHTESRPRISWDCVCGSPKRRSARRSAAVEDAAKSNKCGSIFLGLTVSADLILTSAKRAYTIASCTVAPPGSRFPRYLWCTAMAVAGFSRCVTARQLRAYFFRVPPSLFEALPAPHPPPRPPGAMNRVPRMNPRTTPESVGLPRRYDRRSGSENLSLASVRLRPVAAQFLVTMAALWASRPGSQLQEFSLETARKPNWRATVRDRDSSRR